MRGVHFLAATAVALVAAAPARADTTTDWWDTANRYYLEGQGAPGPRSPDMERVTTRAALAMFEAVNMIDRRYQSYLGLALGNPKASQDAAAATAGYKVLLRHYPANKAALDESYLLTMTGIADGPAKVAGISIGDKTAEAAMGVGGIAPAIAQPPFRPRTAPGAWIGASLPSLDPYWVGFKPWAMPSAEALRPPPPPALTSERYARDYEEVRRLGGKASKERTPLQTLIARYRQAFEITPSIRLATDAGGRAQVDNARLLALYQMAFDDAVHAMVVAKQHYGYWRPMTAIRNGDQDGNAGTELDAAWTPLLSTPNFQEYPCGHCTVAAVIAEVMKSESGWPKGARVRVGSMLNPSSVVQTLPDWDEWAQQVSDSRIYGGVHYRFSNEAGEAIGRKAARIAIDTVMQPLKPRK